MMAAQRVRMQGCVLFLLVRNCGANGVVRVTLISSAPQMLRAGSSKESGTSGLGLSQESGGR
jgi:hypothetical protein